MKAIKMYQKMTGKLSNLTDLPLFFFRLILAVGFFTPAMMKWKNIGGIAEWFGSMGIPMPLLNAYMAATTEMAAVILLPLGLATRFISIPLMITMVVAIVTVHIGNGFNAGDNGYEIPLYYMLMLLALLISGAGKFSLDHLISGRIKS
ncbi:MAG: DoxX family protein [Bacteroidales bacterium]|nr:DoxX family protein [Bacteroidales bacterium]